MRLVRVLTMALLAMASVLLTLAPSSHAQETSPGLLSWLPGDARPTAKPAGKAANAPAAAAKAVAEAVDDRPQAVLVRNPSTEDGAPPYALADDQGTIQRFVEPTPGVDLEPYLRRIIRVEHDTGATLLASQLDLPLDPTTLPGPITAEPVLPQTSVQPQAMVSPVQHTAPVASGSTGEPLPEPIVLEEVIGEPSGPVVNGLQFPPALRPAGPPPVVTGPAAAGVAAACVDCGSTIGGSCPKCALRPAYWFGGIGGLLSDVDASVEALWLRAHDSAGLSGGSDYETGSRWELGINGDWNHRLALRYFEYDSPIVNGRLDVEAFDLEFQRRFPLGGRAEWGVGGGVRWAEYDEAFNTIGTPSGISYSESIGPLLGLYARVPAFGRVDGILTLRQSLQFGDSTVGGAPGSFGSFGITEFQAGLERRRRTRFGETRLRGVFEAQNWTGVGNAPLSSDRGLVGFGLGFGLRR